jgi:iron complex transport system permease protein
MSKVDGRRDVSIPVADLTAPVAGAGPGRRARALTVLGAAGVLLAVAVLLSLGLGARHLGSLRAVQVLLDPDGSPAATIVHELRVPRTVLGLVVGTALGMSGAVVQGLTRNPLADPGLLGVTMGASTAVVLAIVVGGAGAAGQLPAAFVGAAVAAVAVQALGGLGGGGAPERLVLAGTAITAALASVNAALLALDPRAFGDFRFWTVGSLAGRDLTTVAAVTPWVLLGALVAMAVAPALNVLALGDAAGTALGLRPGRTRLLATLAVTLLCGAATAAAGPIGFVGLAVPHAVRLLAGPDQRWVVGISAVLAPAVLLGADVLGRVVVAPGELQVGVVTAFAGAPLFVALARRRRLVDL